MANKRMFSKDITDSDAFIEMSSAAQALYFHLNQGADDDGFNNQVQMAIMKAHASTDDLKILMAKNFVIRFECGVIVIKHWRLHNTLRKDRYTPTSYQDELSQLGLKDNGAYTLDSSSVANWLPDGCQTVAKWLPQVSVGEKSIEKDRLVECKPTSEDSAKADTHATREKEKLKLVDTPLAKGVVFLSDEQRDDLINRIGQDDYLWYVGRLADYILKNNARINCHYQTILKWHREDNKEPIKPQATSNKSYDVDDVFAAAWANSQRELNTYEEEEQ